MRKPKNEIECPGCGLLLCVHTIPANGPIPDSKLEAGCKVRSDSCLDGMVLYVDGDRAFVAWEDGDFRGGKNVALLTVTAPATPEAGDYVQLRNGKCGMIDCCIGNGTGGAWRILKESRDLLWYHRSDITIICKAGR